jgi:hypothetical protein
LLIAQNTEAADNDIGRIMALTPGANLIRGGQTLELKADSAVRESDSISTDETGRVKILFDDDSMVSLGGNTTIEIRDYLDQGPTRNLAATSCRAWPASSPAGSSRPTQGVSRSAPPRPWSAYGGRS